MKDKKLRFAALTRVSTAKQEKKGESLNIQKEEIADCVKMLDGTVSNWYGGVHEHATPGHGRAELERLIEDAQLNPRPFDAVIVTHVDRWSRGDESARRAIELFKNLGIKFFVGLTEIDFFGAETVLAYEVQTSVAKFLAHQQVSKSYIARIKRARDMDAPTCGNGPWGRNYNKTKKKWELIPEKVKITEEIADRYLNGETIIKLSLEFGMGRSQVYRVLFNRSSDKFVMKFSSKILNRKDTIEIKVPRLLPEAKIEACRRMADDNRTKRHPQIKHKYLLGRMIYCSHCGHKLTGQTPRGEKSRYTHMKLYEGDVNKCQRPAWHSSVRAEHIEEVVIRHIFEELGNPVGAKKALEAAIPNLEEIKQKRMQAVRIEKVLEKSEKARGSITGLIKKDLISDEMAENELIKLKKEETALKEKLGALSAQLDGKLAHENVDKNANDLAARIRKIKLAAITRARAAGKSFSPLSWEDKRELLQTVFDGKDAEGRELGVYIEWLGSSNGKFKWKYEIHGRWNNQIHGKWINDPDLDYGGGFGPASSERMRSLFPNTFDPASDKPQTKSTTYLRPDLP